MPQNDFLLLSDGIPAGSSRRDGEALAVTPQPCTVTPAEGTELGAERGCWSPKHQILAGSTRGRARDGTQQRGQHSRKATGQGDAAQGKQSPGAELCLQDKTLPAAPGQQGWDKPQLGEGSTGCKRRLRRHTSLQPSTPPPPSQNGFWQNSNYSAPGFSNEVEKKKKNPPPGLNKTFPSTRHKARCFSFQVSDKSKRKDSALWKKTKIKTPCWGVGNSCVTSAAHLQPYGTVTAVLAQHVGHPDLL